MASEIIGRRPCLLGCGHESAHVKQSDRCIYMYCPGCGLNGPHARTEQQRQLITKGMRPTPTPTGEAVPAAPEPTPTSTQGKEPDPSTPPAPAKRRGLFG